ncbi:MAG TPA: type I secretion system permease/ATPase [Aliidongia sp.]|nr:type I secretion system permease/ATPase [Aliidongia sp.]
MATTRSAGQQVLDQATSRFWQGMLLAGGLTAAVNLLMLLVPIYDLQIYDRVMTTRSVETLATLTIAVVVGMGVCAFFDYLRSLVFVIMSDRFSRKLTVVTLEAALAGSLKGSTAGASQAMRDLADIKSFIASPDVQIPLEFVWTPVYILLLFFLHPYFGLFGIACASFLMLLSWLTDALTRAKLAEANDSQVRAFAEISSTVRHAEAVEGMGMLPAIARRWQRRQIEVVERFNAPLRTVKLLAAITKSSRLLMAGMVIAIGALVIMANAASPGAIMAASLIVARTLSPFDRLISGWRRWVYIAGAYKRIHALLGGASAARGSEPMPATDGRLSVDRLLFIPAQSTKPVIRGMSFTVEPGEVVGIIGPSAAGKSTLARLVSGLFEPSSGGIYLDGISTFLWERESFGQAVGYLPQSVSLMEGTVRENIARMTDADPRDVIAAARKAGVHEMIGRLPFGYETQVGDTGYSLSGGQRQRIALARALFGNPKLLILDEPNANLDGAGEQALLAAITAAKAMGTTVLLIAHRPSIIAVCDKVMVMKDGQIDQFGPRDEVMKTITIPRPAEQPRLVTA